MFVMSLGEKCGHQGIVDNGHHALFNEKWERCKNCSYNLEENRRCPDYAKTSGYISDLNLNLISSMYSANNQDLNKAIA
jgi:hypothetical protein